MARHLLIGAEASSAASAGVVTAGGIQIQKESASGPTELALGDSVADAPRIRFVQGTVSRTIYLLSVDLW